MVEVEDQLASNATMDIYIRMNEDPEQDYCFNVPCDQPVSWLHGIFDTLPMVLSPSYFFDYKPIGFAVSTHPGFLTAEGGLLFHDKAHHEKWLKKVDQNAKIEDICFEGQLIIPIWRHNTTRQLKVFTLLGAWLYADFPQYLHPTPGYAPTALAYDALIYFLPSLEDNSPSQFNSPIWQWLFFAVHLLKAGFIYLILWAGGVNPVSFNPVKNKRSLKKDITRDDLLAVGWTSSRRATGAEWREEYRKNKIDQHGGVVNAYHAGVLEGIGKSGVFLEEGEGWNTNPKEIGVKDDGKFRISKDYLVEVYKVLAKKLGDPELEDEQKGAIIKQFRRSGPEAATPELKAKYEARKKLDKSDL